MPCNPSLPLPAPPGLPDGLSLTPPAIALPTLPETMCCRLPSLPTPDIPIPLGPLLTLPPVVTALRGALAAMRTFLDAQLLICPRE